jgi:uncharacterized protein YndB with AHSA1/START domain
VPTVRRRRRLAASQESIWEVVSDPHHLPRWWPGVKRVEGVADGRFTQVLMTRKGRPVRVDFSLEASEPPRLRAWRQEIAGTPFERVLAEAITEVVIEPDPESGGSEVTIEQRQRLRGYSRTGGFMLRRATRERLDEALDGLARIFD